MDLSPHFTLEELTHSDKAQSLGLDNTPEAHHVANLKRLVDELLEPARDLVGPLHINSGYRCLALNTALSGSSKTSAHMDGRAADVVPVKVSLQVAWDLLLDQLRTKDLPIDQLILESSWIHLGIARDGELPRFQALIAHFHPGGVSYVPAS